MKRRHTSLLAALAYLTAAPLGLEAQGDEAAKGMEPITLGQRTSIRSEVLGEDRPLLIYTPSGYKHSSADYPVLYLLDGGVHFLHASGVTQFLSRVRGMPEMIVVGVENVGGSDGRTQDMTPASGGSSQNSTGGAGSDFLKFLRDELQPWVDSRYRTSPYRVLVGHSLGGLFGTQVLIEDPTAFQAYILISPSLWWEDGEYVKRAASMLDEHPQLRGALYVTLGNEGGEMLAGVWTLTSILETMAPESFRWKWTLMPEETHGSIHHRSLYEGLEWLFEGWYLLDAAALAVKEGGEGWVEIHGHYSRLSERIGVEVKVPERIADAAGQALVLENRFDEALRWYENNRELYPGSARVFNHLGDFYRTTCRWEESKANYTTAYGMARDMSYPDVDTYRDELAAITAQIESSQECVVPGERTGIDVSLSILETYVGEYDMKPYPSVVVTIEDAGLFVQFGSQPILPVFAESESRFFLKVSDVQLSFSKDASGTVTGMVIHQDGRDVSGTKVK